MITKDLGTGESDHMRLFHIVDPAVWARAVDEGEYRPASLDTEGFVHFSFAEQVEGTANARYRGASDLIVIEVDSDAIAGELRIEDSYGSGVEFPHIYGPIPTVAALGTHQLHRDGNGEWVFTPAG